MWLNVCRRNVEEGVEKGMGRGCPPPHSLLDAFGVCASVVRPPTQIPGYACGKASVICYSKCYYTIIHWLLDKQMHFKTIGHVQRRSVGYRPPGRTAILPPQKVVRWLMPLIAPTFSVIAPPPRLPGAACCCSAPLISHLDKTFGPLPPIVCLFLSSDFLLLDVAPFLSLVHVYGTIWIEYYLLAVSADI